MKLNIVTCRGALARLYEYIDRELSPSDERAVRLHLKICRECSRKFRFEEQLLADIRQKCQAVQTPEGLQQRIAELLNEL